MENLELMGITHYKPTVTNCPDILSFQAKAIWRHFVEYNDRVIAAMPHKDAWTFILGVVHQETAGNGLPWIDPSMSTSVAREQFSLRLSGIRALCVAVTDATKTLNYCKFSGVKRAIEFDGKNVVFVSEADVDLHGIDKNSWLNHIQDHRFRKFGRKYSMFGLQQGCSFVFHAATKISVRTTITLSRSYIPESCAVPIVNSVMLERALMPLWKKAISTFPYKTPITKHWSI